MPISLLFSVFSLANRDSQRQRVWPRASNLNNFGDIQRLGGFSTHLSELKVDSPTDQYNREAIYCIHDPDQLITVISLEHQVKTYMNTKSTHRVCVQAVSTGFVMTFQL